MTEEPQNLVLALLREMRAEMADMRAEMADVRAEMATKSELADLRSEVHSLRADVASDLLTVEKRLADQIVGLRRAVMEYHSSAVGHGALISELEERVRRVEEHLKLPPRDAH
ncbi:hypothetical protein [Methylocystis heyeri]|uniref:Uncharacterized protein n=1 Tax=Methylocystis heyeri TaxID=391905 RepID=A0A6B8KC64_9HYPH|nr:hypothetical protein [Methylocystis heyeri]QGM45162.1 hypothetical protein H2LOC_005350 [Methylocystis heyeri]